MKILLIILLSIGSIVVLALLIAAVFGIELIDKVFDYFDDLDRKD